MKIRDERPRTVTTFTSLAPGAMFEFTGDPLGDPCFRTHSGYVRLSSGDHLSSAVSGRQKSPVRVLDCELVIK